jgi:hypothetical protein
MSNRGLVNGEQFDLFTTVMEYALTTLAAAQGWQIAKRKAAQKSHTVYLTLARGAERFVVRLADHPSAHYFAKELRPGSTMPVMRKIEARLNRPQATAPILCGPVTSNAEPTAEWGAENEAGPAGGGGMMGT